MMTASTADGLMTYPRLRPFFLPHLTEPASVSPFLHPPVMAPVSFGCSSSNRSFAACSRSTTGWPADSTPAGQQHTDTHRSIIRTFGHRSIHGVLNGDHL